MDLVIGNVAGLNVSVEEFLHLHSSLGRRLKPKSAPIFDRARVKLARLLLPPDFAISRRVDRAKRAQGTDLPQTALTMTGEARLRFLASAVGELVTAGVPGDLIETGVWRGGSGIVMRAALEESLFRLKGSGLGGGERKIFLADSFEGLPAPYQFDSKSAWNSGGLDLSNIDYLSVAEGDVRRNLQTFGFDDDDFVTVKGWFHESLPTLANRRFALIRLDGDLYSSTMVALENLYPSLSPGGYLIVDDWAIEECREAVEKYRSEHKITEEIKEIDGESVFWVKRVQTVLSTAL